MKKSLFIFTGLLAGCLQLAQASYLDRGTRIAGGEPAPITRWAVKVGMGCTGEALNDRYILTARHCTDGREAKNIKVYYSEGPQNQPSSIGENVAKIFTAPINDTAILYLSKPHKLDKYVDLDLNYNPSTNVTNQGTEMGYGGKLSTDHRDPNALYQIKVKIDTNLYPPEYSYQYPGKYIKTSGINGYTLGGDSGGPLLVNGKLVGTLWGGNKFRDYYAYLAENAQWIKSTIGAVSWQERILIYNSMPDRLEASLDKNNNSCMTTDSNTLSITSGQAKWINVTDDGMCSTPKISWSFLNGNASLTYKNSINENSRVADIEVKGINQYRKACDNNNCPSTIQKDGYIFVDLGAPANK